MATATARYLDIMRSLSIKRTTVLFDRDTFAVHLSVVKNDSSFCCEHGKCCDCPWSRLDETVADAA
jgi:hypothetical protein